MKRILSVGGIIVAVVIAAALTLFFIKYPDVPPAPSLSIERTPERIARGKYLAEHVTGCMDCHSARDWKYFAAPLVKGSEGKGGEVFDENIGVPGTLYAPNITPAGIGRLTDGELFRTITSGVTREGRVLFPLMPYPNLTMLSDEDLYSIIAYIRTLTPIENSVQTSHVNFPMNLIIRTVPARHIPQPVPDENNPQAYGKYLVTAAGCADCHTPQSNGNPIAGMEFAGGMEFKTPQGTIRSANITPDASTGIGGWSREAFIARFKHFASDSAAHVPFDSVQTQTIMPWDFYAGMTEKDLAAIYTHLKTVAAVRNEVVHYTK
jgi:mono/diheme cytochrome c family protein